MTIQRYVSKPHFIQAVRLQAERPSDKDADMMGTTLGLVGQWRCIDETSGLNFVMSDEDFKREYTRTKEKPEGPTPKAVYDQKKIERNSKNGSAGLVRNKEKY